MRKHFLLLFLMAILPYVGWADAFNLGSVTTVRAVYPQGMQQIVYNAQDRSDIAWTFEYQKEGSTEWYAIDKTQCDIVFYYGAAGNTATPGDAVTPKNAGQYYVGITAKANSTDYTNNSAVPAAKRPGFVIQRFPMTIQADGTQKVYGDADPTTLTWDIVDEQSLPEPKENIAITFAYERTGAAAGTDDAEQVNANGYELTCTATATNYDITVTGSPKLVITPATLKVFYDVENNISKKIVVKYGTIAANTPLTGTSTDKVSFDGWKRNDAPAANAAWAFGTLTLTPSAVTANVAPDGDGTTLLDGKVAHIAYISLGEVTKVDDKYVYGNYYVDYQSPALYVQQATIENTTGAFTFAKNAHAAFTYDGASHVATYTIKYGTVGGTQQTPTFTEIETLTAGTDYTIDWKYGDADDPHNNKWAGTYTAIIKAVANGNYYTAAEGVTLNADALKYEIGRRDLAVYSEDDSKTYNAEAPTLDENKVYWSGLVQDDQTLATTLTMAAKNFFELKYVDNALNTTAPVNKGTYKVVPAAKATLPDNDLKTSLTTNYTFQFSQSNFTINAKAITITALPQSIKFGDQVAIETTAKLDDNQTANINEATVDLGQIVAGQEETMLGYLVLSLKADTYTAAKPYKDAIEVSLKDNTGLTEQQITAKTTFLNNYTIQYEPGDFVIAKATFKMFAKTNSVIYGETYELTKDYGFDYGTLDFAGTIAADANITYTLEKNGVELTELPTDAGTYQINVHLATEDVPAGYDAPTYIQGSFTINPRPITVTPVAQALSKGALESALETYNIEDSKVTFSYTGDDDKDAIIGDDEIDYTLIFNVQTATEANLIPAAQVENSGTQTAPVWKLIAEATETTYPAGITVKAGENANYVITAGTGALTVIGAKTLVLDRNDVDLVGKIQAAAAVSNEDYTVRFANRTMKAKKWYAMVLPFPTSVSELSPVFGYAVVNVLKKQTDPSKVQFKLYMEEIPANTPFLVKVYDAANKTGYGAEGQYGVDLSKVTVKFSGKTITTVANDGLAEVTDGTAGNKFIGTYKAKTWTETSDYRWILNSGAGEDGKFVKCDQAAGQCSALGAYLETAQNLSSFAPAIFVEEPDGSTTAINTVTGEQINFVNDAWYTLNGVKLQGMPTEKGVYINNGKKIVIK